MNNRGQVVPVGPEEQDNTYRDDRKAEVYKGLGERWPLRSRRAVLLLPGADLGDQAVIDEARVAPPVEMFASVGHQYPPRV